MFTRLYGPYIVGEREAFLQKLVNLRNLYTKDLWIVGGDFNMITTPGEKAGRIRRADVDMEAFNETVPNLHLVDMPIINGFHRWNNRIGGTHRIACRMDRFLLVE